MLAALALSRTPGAWSGELRATLALAWPIILTNAAQIAFNTTDVILFGRLGPDALAAGALAANLHFATLIFGLGLVTAVSPLVAVELGRNRFAVREVRRSVRQGFWAALTVSLPIMAVLWHGEVLLRLLGQRPELAAEAEGFLRTVMWSVPFFLGYLVLRSLLAAFERPGWALVASGIAVPLNAALAYALIFGHWGFPRLGLAGAGISTSFATAVMMIVLAVVCVTDRRIRRYRLFGRFWRADWPRYRALWRLGAPIGAIMAFEVLIFNAAAFLMGLISPTQLAAHAIALQIAAVAFMVPLGLGQAATVRVGLAYGARDAAGVRIAGWTAFGVALAYAGLTALLMILAPLPLVGAFLDLNDPRNQAVVGFTVTFLALAGIFQLADSAQAVLAGMLRGLQDTQAPMWLAGIGYWLIGAPLGAALAFQAGLEGLGVWIGLAGGLGAVALLLLVRWTAKMRALAEGRLLTPQVTPQVTPAEARPS